MALTCKQVLLMLGMLVTGSINTLTKKIQLQCIAEGYKYENSTSWEPHKFNHPWFQTWLMFIGETTCLIGLFITRHRQNREYERAVTWSNQLGKEPPRQEIPPRIFQWILIVPTCCDLLGTSLAGIGLIYVDASVWQMLRGAIIIFAGILSKIFLKRKLKPIHWLGMMVVMAGLILVGCSSVFKNKNSQGTKAILGIVLILAGQLVSASQMIIEELFLKKRNFPPLQVVGMEGMFGFLLMTFIILPSMYFIPGSDANGSYENSLDALVQMGNNAKLLIMCIVYLLSIGFYNFFGLAVTRSLTAVHRTLIDACRTIIVWLASLFVYYAIDETYGEPFDKSYGLLQVDGFAFLLMGTALYNQLMDVPCMPWCTQEHKVEAVKEDFPNAVHPSVQDDGNIEESYNSMADENTALLQGKAKKPAVNS
ncbi:solute carrier family 35 member F6-like isoform X1 [Biomphalaria pfeifferi]|uniref:Solute carrier family 35 member F6-like isoform X1 n=1 Tax=Biomphalaria pfeifferi TaxID=112525 RepID=A0AAD8ATR7_BIOPF|nr:solute carrier family 35 member F6-like isoform X1 [Biomphalaria pfeifferi]